MQAQLQQKLAIKLGDAVLAEKLVRAGVVNPAMVRRATDEELERILGKSGMQKVRGKLRHKA